MTLTLPENNFDGKKLLKIVLQEAGYDRIIDAVAGMTLFAHPDTVAQTVEPKNNSKNGKSRGVFRIVRNANRRRDYEPKTKPHRFMYDDNTGPTNAFVWAHESENPGLKRYKVIQFNHVWNRLQNEDARADAYTNLANICVTPAFLAKLTDIEPYVSYLRYRVYEFFHWYPQSERPPEKPERYDEIEWADTLPPIDDLERNYRDAMKAKNGNRTTTSCRKIGWIFNNYRPDEKIVLRANK